MKRLYEFKKLWLVFLIGALIFSLSGCSKSDDNKILILGYPIDSDVQKTDQKTVVPGTTFLEIIPPQNLSQVSTYDQKGYGIWAFGGSLVSETRADNTSSGKGIMPDPGPYVVPSDPPKAKLLNFFAMTDVHMTDKESPAQLIYLQQLYYSTPPIPVLGNYPWDWETSVYSPVMLYTTQVLDAAVQTINALHKQPGKSFDFGICLGDVANSSQYNELRWFIDVLDGKVINPSSGAHAGAGTIDYQKPYKAAGLDKTIPWYQTIGNHDHFFIGSLPVGSFLGKAYISDTVMAMGDILLDTANVDNPLYYMGVIDGSTPYGNIIKAGLVSDFSSPPKVVADPDRRSILRTEWISEFFNTTSKPVGHGFNLVDSDAARGFACYSFVPKSTIPIKVIVLDDTQMENDGDSGIHGHGFLDAARWTWLKKELADGDAAHQLMIIAAHIPIGLQKKGSNLEWWDNTQNAVTLQGLITELHSHPNLLMWIAGHRHYNTIKAFPSPVSSSPENGFWQVETSSLRDFPQQFRTFEIYLNSDYTISIVATNVDPAVKAGTPAATSRKYAVAAQQITRNNGIYQVYNPPSSDNAYLIDYGTQAETGADPSIKPMSPLGSYNATLYKQLSPAMKAYMQAMFP